MLPRTPHSPPFGHSNPCQPIPNPAVFITTLFTLLKQMAPHGRSPSTTTHTPTYTNTDIPIVIYPWQYKTPSQYSPLHISHWLWPLILTPSSHLVPPPRFHLFQSHCNITYVTAHHTRNFYSFHIWYSNAVTTFETNPYPHQYHLQVHSATSLRIGNISI